MRKLKQSEIDAAPGWANFYSIQKDKPYFTELAMDQRELDFKPIHRKEFDINEYEFDCESVSKFDDGFIEFNAYGCEKVAFSREDWIAGAKHFKLTAEDLR